MRWSVRRALGLSSLVVCSFAAIGCSSSLPPVIADVNNTSKPAIVAANEPGTASLEPGAAADRGGSWIGAAGDSDLLVAGVNDTSLGVWVDIPASLAKVHAPADVAVVVDTSGSMAGAKIENARQAVRALVEKLSDGDIVSVATFSDEAHERVAPTVLSKSSRAAILAVVASLHPDGGTNLFDGLKLAQARAAQAPATHPVRRVVLVSDGKANVGPSSPEILGALAARGADRQVQVTSIGVGLDYDEGTLDALAQRSSGRLYHVSEARELTAMTDQELKLLQGTAATDATVEIVPAPGVAVLEADGIAATRLPDGTLRVPLGTMFGGQHREMLVHLRVVAPSDGERHALASVRLRFRDPTESNLDRVQEVVARYQTTTDAVAVEAHANGKTRAIAAMVQASKATLAASREVNAGNVEQADQALALEEQKIVEKASKAKDAAAKKDMLAAATVVQRARASAKAVAAAPAPARAEMKRAKALEMNHDGMAAAGF
jgi:Ca-activated chloride channel family protein